MNVMSLWCRTTTRLYISPSSMANTWQRRRCLVTAQTSTSLVALYVHSSLLTIQCTVIFTRATVSLLRQRIWLAGWLGGWLGVRHTPVLYQNGKTYLKTFSTTWKPHHSSFLRPLRPYTFPRGNPSAKYTGVEKMMIFVRFSTDIVVYLGNGAR